MCAELTFDTLQRNVAVAVLTLRAVYTAGIAANKNCSSTPEQQSDSYPKRQARAQQQCHAQA